MKKDDGGGYCGLEWPGKLSLQEVALKERIGQVAVQVTHVPGGGALRAEGLAHAQIWQRGQAGHMGGPEGSLGLERVRKRMEEAAPVSSCSQQPWPDVLPWGSVSIRCLWRNRASGIQRERSRPGSRKSWSTWASPHMKNMPSYTSHRGKLTPTTKCHLARTGTAIKRKEVA